ACSAMNDCNNAPAASSGDDSTPASVSASCSAVIALLITARKAVASAVDGASASSWAANAASAPPNASAMCEKFTTTGVSAATIHPTALTEPFENLKSWLSLSSST